MRRLFSFFLLDLRRLGTLGAKTGAKTMISFLLVVLDKHQSVSFGLVFEHG
jgi:hypothetical protein